MARTFAALLVDSDLKGLESLIYGFQGAGWRNTACAAPETAPFLIKASAAEIAVIATRAPHDKTLNLLRQLRANDQTRGLPLLVLGPPSLRPGVLDCGSVDFLPTPVFVRDVIAASRILVSLSGPDANAQGQEAKVDGLMADFGFFSLIRVMCEWPRSGVLHVERANHRGEILFSEGEIVGAQLGSLQGPPAIHHLVLWEDAKIELRFRAVVRRTQFHQRFDQVIGEAQRFVRDYAHAIQGIGPASSVYGKNDEQLAKASVPSEVTPVLRLCDGRRALADIIDESPFQVFDTVRILTRLVDLGALTRCAPQKAAPASAPPLEQFWETARIASFEDAPDLPLSQRPTPLRLGPADLRTGEPNRRKGQRRTAVQTPILGTAVVCTPAPETPVAGAPDTAPLAAATAHAAKASVAKTSGSIDVSAAGNRRQTVHDRRNRPSVTVDAALVDAAASSVPAAVPAENTVVTTRAPVGTSRVAGALQVAPSSGQHPSAGPHGAGGGLANEIHPRHAAETAAMPKPDLPSVPLPLAGSSAGAQATATGTGPGDKLSSARVTGTLSVSPSQRSGTAKARARAVSVELDPVLMAELGDLERATAPIGPPMGSAPSRAGDAPSTMTVSSPAGGPAETSPSPQPGHAVRITGTLSISASPRAAAKASKTPARGASVALDPTLVAEAQRLRTPEPQPASKTLQELGSTAKSPAHTQSSGKGQQAATRPTPRSSDDSASQTGKRGRISGAFTAVESDFFAREADLYKREVEDNFSDLDEPASKRNGRNSTGGGRSKRRA